MAGERVLAIDLGTDADGTSVRLAVVAEQVGQTLVSDEDVVARLGALTAPIERVSREVLNALKRAAPTKATVELSFGIAIESSGLVAMIGKGKGEGSITVTLEWDGREKPETGG
ncbi:CU044_2847 family protein [Lysobacter korlensis]|uniref:CU044_2847 family protein n=1 Tax=Lysobacter korlensis TaxID=553636 RepID=A0ABV6RWS0_9GAMM